ncbi:hypothetical protein LDO26_09785 [Luteimonas sp. BDR2-5]|uniref:hypothetical protein n=1 Tax=Proluteimonas luteida TaxID=2878685 RepID=UPI001E368C98|nr:hypothetical protein [Luteimonas sp. BDR2-5]MCD9028496.1 hypothetical protein [Luteimonas sp. BDR2-5]
MPAALALIFAVAPASAPALASEPDALDRAAVLEDLQVVRTQYLPREMAYAPATRALAEAQLDALERRAGELTAAQFLAGLSLVAGLADNAHSTLRQRNGAWKLDARLPLRLLWLPDALIVARAHGEHADLAGARVLKVEGRSTEALYAGAKALLGGNDAYRRQALPDHIELAGILHALQLAESPDRLALTLRLADGRTVERSVPMVAASTLGAVADYDRLWSPEPLAGEDGWATALDAGAIPLYLREADLPFRAVPLPELRAHYLQFRSNSDMDGHPIADFLKDAGEAIASARPTHLVVDLRFNTGGNLGLTLDFMRGLADMVPGRTWLLVGPYTFSAGIISAAAIKQGGDRVTIVGDGLGDRLHFWSEGARIELPNSGYAFRYTDGQFNLAEGCTGEPACFDDLHPVNVNRVPLEPDIRAPLTVEAYLAGRDPAMEAVREAIQAADEGL